LPSKTTLTPGCGTVADSRPVRFDLCEQLASHWGIDRDKFSATALRANLCPTVHPPEGVNNAGDDEAKPKNDLDRKTTTAFSFKFSVIPASLTNYVTCHLKLPR
jgi:hypothetical protein